MFNNTGRFQPYHGCIQKSRGEDLPRNESPTCQEAGETEGVIELNRTGLAFLRMLHTFPLSSLASPVGSFRALSSTAAAISMYGIFREAGAKLRPRLSTSFSSVVSSCFERFTTHLVLSMRLLS